MNKTTEKKTKYLLSNSFSKQFYETAQQVMPGGNTRHSLIFNPHPVYVLKGTGCKITDADGEERIDFLNNYTSLIHGHANPDILDGIKEQIENGICFGMPTESELKLAKLLTERIIHIEHIRFCNSGTEAVMMAIKAARAYTGRHKIAKIEGAFHGTYDYAQVSDSSTPKNWGTKVKPASTIETGTPPSIKHDVVVLPWNDTETCMDLIEKSRKDLAAILLDPLPLNLGLIPSHTDFLKSIVDCAKQNDILFIADEVLSFRLSYHGACQEFKLKPDIVALGKIIGGGLPIGAVGGGKEIMAVFDHRKEIKVRHYGTFNANPLCMTAGLITMQKMTPQTFDHLNQMGNYIRNKIDKLLTEKKIKAQVTGKGSLFWIHPTDKELKDYRSLLHYERKTPIFESLAHRLLANGILTCPSRPFGCLSTPMGRDELDAFVSALDNSLDLFPRE